MSPRSQTEDPQRVIWSIPYLSPLRVLDTDIEYPFAQLTQQTSTALLYIGW